MGEVFLALASTKKQASTNLPLQCKQKTMQQQGVERRNKKTMQPRGVENIKGEQKSVKDRGKIKR